MKKTTASVEQAVVIILQSVRRTRSRRRDFCVQMGFGVCTNKHPLAKWIARGIACRFLVPRIYALSGGISSNEKRGRLHILLLIIRIFQFDGSVNDTFHNGQILLRAKL